MNSYKSTNGKKAATNLQLELPLLTTLRAPARHFLVPEVVSIFEEIGIDSALIYSRRKAKELELYSILCYEIKKVSTCSILP